MVYTLRFFSLQNAVCFIILTYLVPVLFTNKIKGVIKLKKFRDQKVNYERPFFPSDFLLANKKFWNAVIVS
jgi:hypothetical protein